MKRKEIVPADHVIRHIWEPGDHRMVRPEIFYGQRPAESLLRADPGQKRESGKEVAVGSMEVINYNYRNVGTIRAVKKSGNTG